MAWKTFDAPVGPQRQYDSTKFGGYDVDTQWTPDQGFVVVGPSGQEREVGRYRGLAEAAANRQAYQLDFSKANNDARRGLQSRASQVEAAGMLHDAAHGGAPSQAAILGGQVGGQSLEGAMQAQAGARGGLAASVAQQQALRAQQQMQIGGMNQYAGMRAGEMEQARGAYLGGVSGIRGQDYEGMGLAQRQADAQAATENFQRDLNQRGEIGFEQRAFDTNLADINAGGTNYAIDQRYNEANKRKSEADTAAAQDMAATWMKAVGSAAPLSDTRAKVMLSDDRTKVLAAQRQAYLLGRAHQQEQASTKKPVDFAFGGPPREDEDIVDMDPSKAPKQNAPVERGKKAGNYTRKDSGPQRQRVADIEAQRNEGAELAGKGVLASGVAGPFAAGPALGGAMAAYDATENPPPVPVAPPAQQRQMTGFTRSDERTKTRGGLAAMAAANRALKSEPYAYKPEFAASEGQAPGEVNVGPMAQTMAADPVAATAVKKDPTTGLLAIDIPKYTKVLGGGLAAAQAQLDEQRAEIDQLKKGRR